MGYQLTQEHGCLQGEMEGKSKQECGICQKNGAESKKGQNYK